jgi:hypothetical protein
MPTYRMVYRDDEQVARETLHGVELERENGWVVFFRDGATLPAGTSTSCSSIRMSRR